MQNFNLEDHCLNDGDDSWVLFSNFCEDLFKFCNKDDYLLHNYLNNKFLSKNSYENLLKDNHIIDCVENFQKKLYSKLKDHVKNSLDSSKLRSDGNDLFKEKMYSDALETYSAAILKAPIPDENDSNEKNELSLAYANRSAAFFNLKKFYFALQDAKFALKYNYFDPEKMKNRIQKCEMYLKTIKDCPTEDEELIGKNNFLESTNEKIIMSIDEKKGRMLLAEKNIQMGETVIKENSFVSLINQEFYLAFCNNCFIQLNGFGIPCDKCDFVIYCSEKCLEESKKNHLDECGKILDLINHLGIGFLILKLVFKVGPKNMLEVSKNPSNSFYASDYKSVYNLNAHADDFDLKENISFTLVSLFLASILKNYSRYALICDENLVDFCKILLHHIQQLSTNLISIDQEISLDAYSTNDIEMKEKLTLGVGIYPVVSLLNHSCVPNVIPIFKGTKLSIKTSKLIEKGNEILFCYGPSFYLDTKKDRQIKLKKQYFFECQCEVCSSGLENKQNAFLCSNCNGPVVVNSDKTNFCLNCKTENIPIDDLRKIFDEAQMLYRVAKKKFTLKKYDDCLVDINEAYEKFIMTCHRHNKEIRNSLSLLIDCYKELNHFSVACKYSKISFKLAKEIFGLKTIDCLNLFMEACNLSYLYNEQENISDEILIFIDEHIKEYQSLEAEVKLKLDNFEGFEELRIIEEIRKEVLKKKLT